MPVFTPYTFRGQISKGSWLVMPGTVFSGLRDSKVSETRLAILSNQDVVLDALGISVQVHLVLRVAYRDDGAV